jgi:hypothetical protein
MTTVPAGGERPPRRWHRWKVSAIAGALGTAYLLQGSLPDLPVWARWIGIAIGAILTIAVVKLDRNEVRRRDEELTDAIEVAKKARREATVRTHGLILPALEALPRLAGEASATRRRDLVERLKQQVVDLAADIRPDARSSLFLIDGTSPNRVLNWDSVWQTGESRRIAPRKTFREGDKGPGDDMFKMIDERGVRLVEDVSVLPGDWFDGPHEYRAYLAVTIAAEDRAYGFLGVDTPTVGGLVDDDIDAIRALANVLAVAMEMGRRRKRSSASRVA